MVEEDKRKWGWHVEDEEHATGGFDSREEAITEALNSEGPGVAIIVGRCEPIQPEHFVRVDADLTLEEIEEGFGDEFGGMFGDPIFSMPDPVKAEAALGDALAAWAREHVDCTHWLLENGERVVLEEGGEL